MRKYEEMEVVNQEEMSRKSTNQKGNEGKNKRKWRIIITKENKDIEKKIKQPEKEQRGRKDKNIRKIGKEDRENMKKNIQNKITHKGEEKLQKEEKSRRKEDVEKGRKGKKRYVKRKKGRKGEKERQGERGRKK